ncbi:HAMP domain-containing sensor histidine kinase [Roseomonas sp. E05]|uniref:sensor histidine kinase n=1 Tax=Roseomonas sp. E05 TaxID=3046310 RepID=UPI0024BAD733|nr:HAMP domain-containing sensor histidine kinase [Roseomonas sp. E05]MDJ0390292.1 HAMP domain-containing sensor histidine kinase [Roseomonas sp. E05]
MRADHPGPRAWRSWRQDLVSLARLRNSSGVRLALLYAAVFVLSSVVLFVLVHWVTVGALRQQISNAVAADIADLLQGGESHGGTTAEGLARILAGQEGAERLRSGLRFAVEDAAGRRLAGDLPALPRRAADGWFESQDEGQDEDQSALLGRAVPLPDGGLLAVARDATSLDETADLIEGAFFWAGGVMLLLGLGGGVLVAHGFLRRVDAIAATAEAIAHGALERRVPVRATGPADEMDRLGGAINAMLDRIRDLMEELRHASAAIAHDLRTPLARLRQGLEAARDGAATPEAYRAAMDAALAETDAILRSFAALLRIAQVEAGARRAAFAPVDLSAIATDLAEAYGPSAEDGGRTLTTAIAPGVTVRGDRELLMQALANLLENALRHTPPGTVIRVRVPGARLPAGPALVVEDDGPGIPPEARAQVLRPFHRLDPSRSDGGSGLGLALVAAVAKLHDAALELGATGQEGRGLRVTLRFPFPSNAGSAQAVPKQPESRG